MTKRKSNPFEQTPMLTPRFGVPEDCSDIVNKYGTYNIQPTSDTENTFPLIAPGLPKQYRSMKLTKNDLEETP